MLPLLLAGCAQFSTYGYQYKLQQQFTGGEEPEPAPVEARQLLANARTVAFFPPDSCLNADPNVDRKRVQELHASCGVMLSTLERAAEKAGYEVLSWQNLRGAKRAIEYAREANVDVLFEINEFDPQPLNDTDVQHTFAFFEDGEGGTQLPLQVSTSLAQSCAQYANQADPPKTVALTGSIDIKTVSVSDGRDRWHYRKTDQISLNRSYPETRFTAARTPNKLARALLFVGAMSVGVGGGLLLAEQVSTDDPTTPTVNEKVDTGGWSTGLIIGGAVVLAGAVAVQVGMGGERPDPANTLCNASFAVARPVAAPVNTMSAEHTFTESTHGDELASARKAIEDQMVAQFIQELTEAHASRARAPAAPAAAPATPGAAPAPANP